MVDDIKNAKYIIWYDDESLTQQKEYFRMKEILSNFPTFPCMVVPAKPLEGQKDAISLGIKEENINLVFHGERAVEKLRKEVRKIIRQN